MAAKPAEEEAPSGETLKYQTWVLKVLIHCDGCTKRVKKILQGIDGVYTTEIDPRQHKVIVTGNVEAETLIKRLSRSGKSVELWPEKPAEKKDKKPEKSKGGGDTKNKEKENQKSSEPVGDGGSNEDCIDAAGDEDSDKEEDHCDDVCEGAANGSGGGGGEGGKKKKKKKKKKNKGGDTGSAPPNNGGGKEISTVETQVPQSIEATPKDLITGPPIQHVYPPYPPHMYYSPPPPPPPPYGLSYNTSYPISSASYSVGAPMVMPMHAYSAAYPPLPPPPPPCDPIKHYGDVDDDEYQGGYCSIM